MSVHRVSRVLRLPSPDATAAFARWLAPRLEAGDVVLLAGEVGAGKTHFARSLIRQRLGPGGANEDIPSPTFTLVQTYQGAGPEIWHADLYRLCEPSEAVELGLVEAFESGICLIEWPDRLGADRPKAIRLKFRMTENPDERLVEVSGDDHSIDRLLADLPVVWTSP